MQFQHSARFLFLVTLTHHCSVERTAHGVTLLSVLFITDCAEHTHACEGLHSNDRQMPPRQSHTLPQTYITILYYTIHIILSKDLFF